MIEKKQPIIISLDGNIGSGKSSVLKYFQNNFQNFCNLKTENYKIFFIEEPVSIWESIIDKNDGENIIEKFYNNNEKYGFAFQMMAYISRLTLLKDALTKDYDIIITERSIFTDKNVFATMLYKANKINEIEYQIYNKWFDEFSICIQKLKTVYIRTCPEICEQRVLKRSRTGEAIPLSYLQNCHVHHDLWLYSPDQIEKGMVLTIDGNQDTDTNIFINNKYYNCIMDRVYNFASN